MPDWYVRRNEEGSAFAFQIRLGGCEYSLTEEEFNELTQAFRAVRKGDMEEVQSADYADNVISHSDNKRSLSEIMGTAAKPIDRRGM